MSDATGTRELRSLARAYTDLLDAQMRMGRDLLQSMTGIKVPDVGEAMSALRSRASKTGGCHIPPPCWMPQPLGEVTSHVDDCHEAHIRLRITNCNTTQRTITVAVTGDDADRITVTPASLSLGPMARGRITLVRRAEKGDAKEPDGERESIVWVRGCRDWYLRWIVSVGTVGIDSTHEIRVDDCHDHLHHWYDHFYCPRPCNGGRMGGAIGQVDQ